MNLEERLKLMEDRLDESIRGKIILTAYIATLQQGLQEVCAQSGISERQFEQWFQKAGGWHFDQMMQKANDASPSFSARIDTRGVEHIPTDEHPAKLFPEDAP